MAAVDEEDVVKVAAHGLGGAKDARRLDPRLVFVHLVELREKAALDVGGDSKFAFESFRGLFRLVELFRGKADLLEVAVNVGYEFRETHLSFPAPNGEIVKFFGKSRPLPVPGVLLGSSEFGFPFLRVKGEPFKGGGGPDKGGLESELFTFSDAPLFQFPHSLHGGAPPNGQLLFELHHNEFSL